MFCCVLFFSRQERAFEGEQVQEQEQEQEQVLKHATICEQGLMVSACLFSRRTWCLLSRRTWGCCLALRVMRHFSGKAMLVFTLLMVARIYHHGQEQSGLQGNTPVVMDCGSHEEFGVHETLLAFPHILFSSFAYLLFQVVVGFVVVSTVL